MRDPYLYEDVPVLINKFGIKEQGLLDEADILGGLSVEYSDPFDILLSIC